MIFGRHPRALLPRAAEGRLSAAEQQLLDAHLPTCATCREELASIRHALAALGGDPLPPLSTNGRDRLLAAAAAVDRRQKPRQRLVLATSGIAGLLLVVTAVGVSTTRVRLLPASGAPAAFESLALAAHRELRQPEPRLDLADEAAAEIRDWLDRHGAFSAALASEHPGEPAGAFRLLGARGIEDGSLRAAAVAARVDGVPVTLLIGRESEVTGIPSWSWLGKRLLVRRDSSSGARLLSWRNAGKAYTLVSDDPERPERACQLCHVDDRRRRAIERVADSL